MLVTLLVLQGVVALGVAPSRKLIDYKPGLLHLEGRVLNNERQDITVLLYADGPLKEYVAFEQDLFRLTKDQSEASFSYTVDVPEGLEPGTQEVRIVVMQILDVDVGEGRIVGSSYETEFNKETFISALQGVVQQIKILVPYPGQWVEGKIYVQSANLGEDVEFVVSVFNRGTEQVNVSGRVLIKGPTNELIDEIELSSIMLDENGEGKIVGVWKDVENSGEYAAEAQILFGDKSFSLLKAFSVGNLFISIEDVVVKGFRLGAIAKFDLTIHNMWNKDIEGVYADFEVFDETGKILETFKSADMYLAALQEGQLQGYWDTEGVDPGSYDLNIVLHYAGKTSEKFFSLAVGLDSIEFVESAVGRVVDDAESFERKYDLLIALVGLLVVLNIVGLVWFVKKGRK